jgi:YD repeat-containing protein
MRVRLLAAQWYEAVRITIAAVLALLAGAAGAESSTLFYNERGQITGSASTSGNTTTFRDQAGRVPETGTR